MAETHVSGFVSILGRPNSGKSTLLNALVGDKLAIVSSKPQTTRTSIQGVVTTDDAQIVFVDTPGIHASENLFDRRMIQTVRTALEDRDLLLFVNDCTVPFSEEDSKAVDILRNVKTPAFLVLNKVDRVQDKRQILPRIEKFKAIREFDEYIPISAKTSEGLERLGAAIVERLPEGPAYFPPDYITDQPERFMAAELLREKILSETRQEVPHSVAVLVEKWEQGPRLTRINATIYVERPGQKAILIGAGGAMLKKIATLAREDMERFFARKVFLEVFVKVRPKWRESAEFLDAIDWRSATGAELKADPER